jgi:hypothetical protein
MRGFDPHPPHHYEIIGGDLNLSTQPSSPRYWSSMEGMVWPGGYREADTAVQPVPLSQRSTTDFGDKLDYVWAEVLNPSQRARIGGSAFSDHHVYEMML